MQTTRPADPSTAHPISLYTLAGWATAIMVAIIPIQILIFVAYPPPDTVQGFFELLQQNWLLGLVSLDLLYILNNTLLAVLYLGLYQALKRVQPALMLVALLLGLLGIAAYYASNTGFELLALSSRYAAASSGDQQAIYLAAGEALLAIYAGTAFNIYYVLNAAALLILAGVMLRSPDFSRGTALTGLAAGVLMVIPSTAGTIGMIFALASLAPWTVFSVLIARRCLQMGRSASSALPIMEV